MSADGPFVTQTSTRRSLQRQSPHLTAPSSVIRAGPCGANSMAYSQDQLPSVQRTVQKGTARSLIPKLPGIYCSKRRAFNPGQSPKHWPCITQGSMPQVRPASGGTWAADSPACGESALTSVSHRTSHCGAWLLGGESAETSFAEDRPRL